MPRVQEEKRSIGQRVSDAGQAIQDTATGIANYQQKQGYLKVQQEQIAIQKEKMAAEQQALQEQRQTALETQSKKLAAILINNPNNKMALEDYRQHQIKLGNDPDKATKMVLETAELEKEAFNQFQADGSTYASTIQRLADEGDYNGALKSIDDRQRQIRTKGAGFAGGYSQKHALKEDENLEKQKQEYLELVAAKEKSKQTPSAGPSLTPGQQTVGKGIGDEIVSAAKNYDKNKEMVGDIEQSIAITSKSGKNSKDTGFFNRMFLKKDEILDDPVAQQLDRTRGKIDAAVFQQAAQFLGVQAMNSTEEAKRILAETPKTAQELAVYNFALIQQGMKFAKNAYLHERFTELGKQGVPPSKMGFVYSEADGYFNKDSGKITYAAEKPEGNWIDMNEARNDILVKSGFTVNTEENPSKLEAIDSEMADIDAQLAELEKAEGNK